MAVIEQDFKANKSAVIEMLIANVLNVNVEVPRVVKGNFDEDEWEEWTGREAVWLITQ